MGKKFLVLAMFLFLTYPNPQSMASGRKMFELDNKGNITASVVNAPLADVLRDFCATFNLDIKGMPASDENISLTISGGTFDETLKRLMRGYNYVLIQDTTSHKPALIVLGRAERSKYAELPSARVAAEAPAYAPIATPPGQQRLVPAPSSSSVSAQDNSVSPNPASGERQKQQDEERTGSVVASARPAHMPGSSNSVMPPMPPNIPGLELPPMPPTLEQARQAQPGAVAAASSNPQSGIDTPPQIPGENSSGQTSPQTPPSMPSSSGQNQQKPKPTVDLKDLTPPPIPF